MLQLQQCSRIKDVLERKNQRLQLTESLQDYFALHPRTYKRPAEAPQAQHLHKIFADEEEESEVSQSHTSTTAKSSLTFDAMVSLDETFHERKGQSNSRQSLDVTFHEREVHGKEESSLEDEASPTAQSDSSYESFEE